MLGSSKEETSRKATRAGQAIHVSAEVAFGREEEAVKQEKSNVKHIMDKQVYFYTISSLLPMHKPSTL